MAFSAFRANDRQLGNSTAARVPKPSSLGAQSGCNRPCRHYPACRQPFDPVRARELSCHKSSKRVQGGEPLGFEYEPVRAWFAANACIHAEPRFLSQCAVAATSTGRARSSAVASRRSGHCSRRGRVPLPRGSMSCPIPVGRFSGVPHWPVFGVPWSSRLGGRSL